MTLPDDNRSDIPPRHTPVAPSIPNDFDALLDIEEEARWRRRRFRRGLLLSLAGALVLAIVLAPRIASLEKPRLLLLQAVNTRLQPAELDIADWRLRWTGRQTFRGISLRHAGWLESGTLERVDLEAGLLRLIPMGRVDLGRVTLTRPRLRIGRQTAPVPSPSVAPAPVTVAAVPAPSSGTPRRVIPVYDLAMELALIDGTVVVEPPAGEPVGLEQLNGRVVIPSLQDPCDGGLAWNWTDGGTAGCTGSVTRLAQALETPRQAAGRLELTLNDTPVARLASFAAPHGVRPAAGRLEARLLLTADGSGEVTFETTAAADRLRLVLPDEERPAMPPARVGLALQGVWRQGRLQVREAALSSPWLSATAAADLLAQAGIGTHPDDTAQVSLRMELAPLRRDWGRLLGINPELTVDDGRVTADLALGHDHTGLWVTTEIRSTNLQFRVGQQALRPTPPPSLSVRARRDAEGVWELLRGELTASFARLSASGTATAGTVQGSLDLTRLAGDLKPIVPALPRMVGEITLAASSRLPHNAPRGTVAAEMVFREVAIAGDGDRPWVIEGGHLTAGAEVPRPSSARWPRAFEQVRLGFAGSPGTLTGRCDRCEFPTGTNRLEWLVEGGQMQARFDLSRLATFLRPIVTLPPRAAVAGQASAGLTLEMAGGIARAAGSGAVQGFALTSAGWDIREPDARFDGRIEWLSAARGVNFSNLTARASFGSLNLPQASYVPDGLRGALQASLDLGVLSGWRKGTPQQQVSGTLALQARADTGASGETLSLEAKGTGIAFTPADGPPWEEPEPTLNLALHRPSDDGPLDVQRLDVALALGQLQGSGTLRPGESLALAGTLALDFDALTRWLHSRGMSRATLEGREPRPFVFHAPLGAGAAGLLAYGHGSLALHLARFSGFGLEARPADVQLTLTNGLLGAAYAPPLASGTLRARGDIALTTTPRVLHLDREAVQLKDIPLTDALLAGLHYVNPLLASATVIEGRASLTLGDGHLPLDGSYVHDTAFDLGLEIDDAVLMPSGVLAQILAHTGAANHSLTLGHETLRAVCRDGRIEIAPHQAMLRDHAVTFSGQIGLDQSLQFLVDVPLTRDLVGEKAAAWIAGQTLRVPAGGTVRKPRIDTDALIRQVRGIVAETARRAVMEQAGQAAELIEKLRKKLK